MNTDPASGKAGAPDEHGEQRTLIDALRDPRRYPHPAGPVRTIETHASWVLLTGPYAYKIKKPVNLGFLDFSTLARRHHFCEEEVRINRRLAPELYLGVVPIGGSADDPHIGDAGAPIDYAVKMRQFDPAGLFDRLADAHALTPALVRECAQAVAAFHASAEPLRAGSSLAGVPALAQAMLENLHHPGLAAANADPDTAASLAHVEHWTREQLARLTPLLQQRRTDGFVRECHGDLHLANITLHEGKVTLFDGIEFNEEFRWIDVISDLAFLLMDLESRGEDALANLALNTWLEFSGDIDGLALLPLYKTYRAMVRAKVALLTAANAALPPPERQRQRERFDACLALARRTTCAGQPVLLCTCGLSASGKSHISAALAARFGLVRLRSDVERKRLFGLAPLAVSGPALRGQLYSPDASVQTYRQLAAQTRTLLAQGQSVIVDAAFLRASERALFFALARELALPFVIVHCEAPLAQRRQWLRQRRNDPSEATDALLDTQAGWFEPFSADESAAVVRIDAAAPDALAALPRRVRERLGTTMTSR